MAIEYINRRGKKYYLHEGKTKTGKPKYFFSMKPEGFLVDTLPVGYEIYENPNAQVFLRKTIPQLVEPEEIAIVQAGVKKYAKLEYFMVDVKGSHIIIYLCDQNVDGLMDLITSTGKDTTAIKDRLVQSFSYSPMMQFVLTGVKTREFRVERWCFLGSVDNWLFLDASTDLKALVKKYVRHLGQDSFFELTPY